MMYSCMNASPFNLRKWKYDRGLEFTVNSYNAAEQLA